MSEMVKSYLFIYLELVGRPTFN